jgi:hypothetical protein
MGVPEEAVTPTSVSIEAHGGLVAHEAKVRKRVCSTVLELQSQLDYFTGEHLRDHFRACDLQERLLRLD